MANSIRLIDGRDFEGMSPTEVKEHFVEVTREQYDAMILMVTALGQLKNRGTMPEELKLSFARVVTAFTRE